MKQAFLAAAAAMLICCAGAWIAGGLFRAEAANRQAAGEAAQMIEMARAAAQTAETGQQPEAAQQPETAQQPGTEQVQDAALPGQTRDFDCRFRLPVLQNGQLVSMELRRYVLGALLGEMPTSFAPEALKAQAIACRTYALRLYSHRKHDPAAVCTDPGCCMCWVDPDVYAAENGAEALEKAERALAETDGMVIRYDGALIDATFFSSSGGRTEDAAAVWGMEVPYLHAVDSPGENSPYDTDTLEIPASSFAELLTAENEMAVFSDDSSTWVGAISYTNGGGVDTAELGGCIYTGPQLRRLFGLRSTAFSIGIEAGTVRFTTRGFGHRVGMSQYGANALAEQGRSAEEILTYYYQGVEISRCE